MIVELAPNPNVQKIKTSEDKNQVVLAGWIKVRSHL